MTYRVTLNVETDLDEGSLREYIFSMMEMLTENKVYNVDSIDVVGMGEYSAAKTGNDDIVKSTFQFEVLHRADSPISDIHRAVSEAWDGDAVGIDSFISTVDVPRERVVEELVAMGNDGEFFNSEGEYDEFLDED